MMEPELREEADRPADSTGSHPLSVPGVDAVQNPPDPPTIRTSSSATPRAPAKGEIPSSVSGTGPRASVETPLPELGEGVGEFELREAIGAGGMGAVFRAFDTTLERSVALKILPPEQASDPEIVRRFYQEARAAARLDHENIARVHSLGHDRAYHYIAFEFIDGTTIRQRVEAKGPLSASEAVNYTLQISDALVHAAERQVVHRDIKPSNIIVTPQGRAKLVDMGLARRFERHRDDGLTQSGMTLGTFDYISPEQARDPRDVDVRSDLYSLGCTLYHMLTGRPPFPEGTVLQKLLQHQEETPPDVRSLNPEVPDGLAEVVAKLMAKDREERYQTPEDLVRALQKLSNSLGLRADHADGQVWSSTAGWQRHLAWAIPTLAFCVVLGVMIAWNQEPSSTGADPLSESLPQASIPPTPAASPSTSKSQAGAPSSRTGAPLQNSGSRSSSASTLDPAGAGGEIVVKSTEDLGRAIETAPARATITLADDGPYVLPLNLSARNETSVRSAVHVFNRDLTIKAASGARPVLRSALPASRVEAEASVRKGTSPEYTMFELRDGRVAFERIIFQVDASGSDAAWSAVMVDGADASFRQCQFRGLGVSSANAKTCGLRVQSKPTPGLRPVPIRIQAGHFDSGPLAIRADGACDVVFSDCTFAPLETAFWVENTSETAASAFLRFSRVSILAGKGPVFRFKGVSATVRIDDSVVAPSVDSAGSLVAVDASSSLDWFGRSNLYGRIRTYLQTTGATPSSTGSIDLFETWGNGGTLTREVGSAASEDQIWRLADPRTGLVLENPSKAFALSGSNSRSDLGVREGPAGPIYAAAARPSLAEPKSKQIEARSTPNSRVGTEASRTSSKGFTEPRESKSLETAANLDGDKRKQSGDATAPIKADRPIESVVMPPVGEKSGEQLASNVDEKASGDSQKPVGVGDMPPPMKEASPDEAISKSDPQAEAGIARPEPAKPRDEPIETSAQFLSAFRALGARGGTLRIAAEADLELPALDVNVSSRCRIVAEPGAGRPKLRFRPAKAEAEQQSLARPSFFVLRQGASLQLSGVDVILEDAQAPAGGRWSAFAVREGTDLELVRSVVTVEGERARSAVVVVRTGDDEFEVGIGGQGPETLAVRLRITDSIIRSGGDLIDVALARKVDAEFSNVLAFVGGNFIHAKGGPEGSSSSIHLVLRQVSALTAKSLAALESGPTALELPTAEINVRDSILAAVNPETPLIQVDGQEPVDPLHDPIRWEGHSVAYHQVKTYRKDSSALRADASRTYFQPEWEMAVGPREDDAIHGDLKFRGEWPPSRPLWSLTGEDAKLAPESPALGHGVDFQSLPTLSKSP